MGATGEVLKLSGARRESLGVIHPSMSDIRNLLYKLIAEAPAFS